MKTKEIQYLVEEHTTNSRELETECVSLKKPVFNSPCYPTYSIPYHYYHKLISNIKKCIGRWLLTKLINSLKNYVRGLYLYLDFVPLVSSFLMCGVTFLFA